MQRATDYIFSDKLAGDDSAMVKWTWQLTDPFSETGSNVVISSVLCVLLQFVRAGHKRRNTKQSQSLLMCFLGSLVIPTFPVTNRKFVNALSTQIIVVVVSPEPRIGCVHFPNPLHF